jgi:hypothetical protein
MESFLWNCYIKKKLLKDVHKNMELEVMIHKLFVFNFCDVD